MVGAVGLNHDVACFDQFVERLTVMHAGRGDHGFEDELVELIDFHVFFVTAVGLVVLLRPAGVEVFVRLDLGVVMEGSAARHPL